MRTARPVGLTPDGAFLMVVTDDHEQIRLPADERLRAALRADRPRLGQLEIEMDSALRPRDIQARIRAGEAVADVARAAGVPVERIDAFAAPVIAEREHVAGLAQQNPVRRRGETSSHRPLRTAVAEQLRARRIDPDDVIWDAFLLQGRRWQIRATFASGSAHHEALFIYDLNGRFSTASNEDAHWLIGDESTAHGPQPGRRTPQRERPADDELAIVRAIQEGPDRPFALDAEVDDAYSEAELTEVDGVYDLVDPERADMDVLYDMLSSFDEDSVKIYSGLVHPGDPGIPSVNHQVPVVPTPPSAPTPDLPEAPHVESAMADSALALPVDPDPVAPAPHETRPSPHGEPDIEEQVSGVELVPDDPIDPVDAEPASESVNAESTNQPAVRKAPQEPEQPPLVDAAAPTPAPKPRPKKATHKRASVPSWDEIMFGAPRKDS